MPPLRVLVLFGGRSGEHEVSVSSARPVARAVEELGYELTAVGISREGRWVRCDPRSVDRVPADGEGFVLLPDPSADRGIDVVFAVFHGPYGEDGCTQGLFELYDLPYVGASVEGSVIGSNKVLHKQLFADAGLPIVDHLPVERTDWDADRAEIAAAVEKLAYPSFVKPARLGSSVGISRIDGPEDVGAAVDRAFRHDDLVLVEGFGGPNELEIAAIEGPEGLELSVVGRVIPDGDFYDYESKYRSDGTTLEIPAEIPDAVRSQLEGLAHSVFRTASCAGLARIDFFWGPEPDRLLVNEINTIPGLTPSSMFPRLWEASGRPFSEVVGLLLDHALARHERKERLEAAREAAHDEEIGS